MLKGIPTVTLTLGIGIGFAAAATITACATQSRSASSTFAVNTFIPEKTPLKAAQAIVDPNDRKSFAALLTELETNRVVFVGETHDRYDHHLCGRCMATSSDGIWTRSTGVSWTVRLKPGRVAMQRRGSGRATR